MLEEFHGEKVFRVGSVGIGGISRGVHLPGIHKSPDLELVAVCDLKPERMGTPEIHTVFREDHCFADYHDLIACPDVDVIDISTSNNAHLKWPRQLLKPGNAFCLEKPVTLTAEEADIFWPKPHRKKGFPIWCAFPTAFKAAARYAKELVEKGMLGDIYHVYMQYLRAAAVLFQFSLFVGPNKKKERGTGRDLPCS